MEPQIKRDYIDAGKVRLVLRQFPTFGEASRRGAEAAACALDQGRFWEYHAAIFQHQRQSGYLTRDWLVELAGSLGLDPAAFGACLDNGTHAAAIEADFQSAIGMGITGTPTFLINGERLVGRRSYESFAQAIEAALGEAGQ